MVLSSKKSSSLAEIASGGTSITMCPNVRRYILCLFASTKIFLGIDFSGLIGVFFFLSLTSSIPMSIPLCLTSPYSCQETHHRFSCLPVLLTEASSRLLAFSHTQQCLVCCFETHIL